MSTAPVLRVEPCAEDASTDHVEPSWVPFPLSDPNNQVPSIGETGAIVNLPRLDPWTAQMERGDELKLAPSPCRVPWHKRIRRTELHFRHSWKLKDVQSSVLWKTKLDSLRASVLKCKTGECSQRHFQNAAFGAPAPHQLLLAAVDLVSHAVVDKVPCAAF